MSRYCIEMHDNDAAVVHKVDCPSYDLGTLLGLGCVADLGEFASTALALDAVRDSHPDAVRCLECCRAEMRAFPPVAQFAALCAIALPST